MKFSLEKKIVIGYLPIILVILCIALLSVHSLNELNAINKSIIEEDTFLVQAAGRMEDALLAQESYGRRYLILNSPQMLRLFQQRDREFKQLIHQVRQLPHQEGIPLGQLVRLHNEFNTLYTFGQDLSGTPPLQFTRQFDEQVREKFDEIRGILQAMVRTGKQNQYLKMQKANSIGFKSFQFTALLATLGIIAGLAATSLITRSMCQTITRLKRTTEIISQGRYDQFPQIDSKDELEELACSLKTMALNLSKLATVYLDCNPLTRMPGGAAIENTLIKCLKTDTDTVFCLLDLDNFKSYNDRYGYAKGNEVIKATAGIIEAVVAEHGGPEDFVGHIGGDDFAVITTAEKYELFCKEIIRRFDEDIVFFYNETDRAQGHIVSKSRQGEEMRFPLMTISIGVVAGEEDKKVNHIELGKTAAELKEYAKSLPGSVFVTNRREKKPSPPPVANQAAWMIQ